MIKQGKAKKRVCIILLCIFMAVYFLYGRAWPRRWFLNFGHYYYLTAPHISGFFPETLSDSAGDIRYHYYYKGFLDEKFGISFTLDKESYQVMKESYQTFFKEQETKHTHRWYEFGEKVTTEFLENEELDDLKHLFHSGEDSYTMLAYEIIPSAKTSYYISGVIYNDNKNEIIIFYFFDAARKEKRDTEI